MLLSSVIKHFEAAFYQRYAGQVLPSHYKALSSMKDCRSERSYLMELQCDDCLQKRYVPHSCGHRNCPHCQQHESQQWIDNQLKRQVKGSYALITFTLPEEFRPLVYAHQRDLYALFFACVWETLQSFCKKDKHLQGVPGVIAVLHTHTRRLDYHPHLHIIMPMAAINAAQGLWREKQGKYLFNHKALAKVFRAKMLAGITELGYSLPQSYPKKWVVDCRAAGEGKKAIIYLGRYLYRGVIQEKDILLIKDGKVTFRYENGQTKKTETRTVSGEEFLWLLVQHVLPKRFRRVRLYGFLHPNSKLLKLVQLITRVFIAPQQSKPRPTLKCTCCGGDMRIIKTRLPANAEKLKESLDLKPQEDLV